MANYGAPCMTPEDALLAEHAGVAHIEQPLEAKRSHLGVRLAYLFIYVLFPFFDQEIHFTFASRISAPFHPTGVAVQA